MHREEAKRVNPPIKIIFMKFIGIQLRLTIKYGKIMMKKANSTHSDRKLTRLLFMLCILRVCLQRC